VPTKRTTPATRTPSSKRTSSSKRTPSSKRTSPTTGTPATARASSTTRTPRADAPPRGPEASDEPASTPEQWLHTLDVLGARVASLIEADRDGTDQAAAHRGRVFKASLVVKEARAGMRTPYDHVLPLNELPERMLRLVELLDLTDLEVGVLLVALAPSLDARFEHFNIVLNNESDARGPSVSTVLRLAGFSPLVSEVRAVLAPGSSLREAGFIDVGPPSRPLVSQIVTVPERLVSFLVGGNEIDPSLRRMEVVPDRPPLPRECLPSVPPIDDTPVVLRARPGTAGRDQARSLTWSLTGREPFLLDLSRGDIESVEALSRCITREFILQAAPVVIDARNVPDDAPLDALLAELTRLEVPVFAIAGARAMIGSVKPSQVIDLATPTLGQRELWWVLLAPEADTSQALTSTHLEPEDIELANRPGESVALMRASGRARRSRVHTITPQVHRADVVLSLRQAAQMDELIDRVRFRSVVLDDWNMRPGGGRGRGVSALFAGASGTGKTMAAEAIAGELKVPLLRVDLATVIDKYIGETEKNLEEVFRAVENQDGVLLFDEADALFGKRSEVSDARDRYANIEVAYLLQRIEQFDGLAILTTNLRANLDDAFQRRLDIIVDFEEPDADARFTIWSRALGPFQGSVSEDDLRALSALDITGGSIRSAVVSAAYYAAADGGGLDRRHLLRGLKEEWRKAGRLTFPAGDFANWA
jgi:hypothetical protein